MVTAAKKTFGTLFKQGSTTIAEVKAIGDVGPESDMIDVTSLDSPNGFREFIAGLKNGGEVQIEMNFLPGNATQQALRTNLTAETSATYNIVWTGSGESWAFTALVKSFKSKGEVEGSLAATVTFQVNGTFTVT